MIMIVKDLEMKKMIYHLLEGKEVNEKIVSN